MRAKFYPNSNFTRSVNSRRIEIGKLHCPECFSNQVFADFNDYCSCKDCYQKFEFKLLLNPVQVRDKKIEKVLL